METKKVKAKRLYKQLMVRPCNDSCMSGNDICPFQKRCDILFILKNQ